MGRAEFYAFVREKFDCPIDDQNISQKAVAILPKLFPGLVLTTNFDKVLEYVYPKLTPVTPPPGRGPLNRALVEKKPLIFKMHGSIDEDENIIITKKAYEEAYNEGTELVEALRKCFSGSILLFLGCSLEQDKTLALLKEMITELRGVDHFAILGCKPKDRERRRKELSDQRIRTILYPDGEYDSVHTILIKLLQAVDPVAYLELPKPIGQSSYANLFRYDANSVGFFGRMEELKSLDEFLNAANPFLWTAIIGAGGSGKTRLGYEFKKRVRSSKLDWRVPELPGNYTLKHLEEVKIQGNTFLVLDYVKWKTTEIEQWMESLYDLYYDDRNTRVRILLVEREAKDISADKWKLMLRKSVFCLGKKTNNFQDNFLALKPLDEVMPKIIEDYAARAVQRMDDNNPLTRETADTALIVKTLTKIDKDFRRPLYTLFLTDAHLRGENLLDWDRSDALYYVCEREMSRLRNCVYELRHDINATKARLIQLISICMKHLVIATLSGGLTLDIVKKLTPDDWLFLESLAKEKWIGNDMVEKLLVHVGIITTDTDLLNSRIHPLEPDLIGEFYCVVWAKLLISDGYGDTIKESIAHAANNDMRATMTTYCRIIHDFEDDILAAELGSFFGITLKPLEVGFGFIGKTKIEIPYGFTAIEDRAYEYFTSLIEVYIPDSVMSIGHNAFKGCFNLRFVDIPDSVTYISSGAFFWCLHLEDLLIPESVIFIGAGAFWNCHSLYEVKIPAGVVSIENYTFNECANLAKVDFSDSTITSIGNSAFEGCISLIEIHIPDSITIIGENAFLNCDKLAYVSLPSTDIKIGHNAFSPNTKIVRIQSPLMETHFELI